MLQLLPILPALDDNLFFINRPECNETLAMSVAYYGVIGYQPPWICYYASLHGKLVGSAAFKGAPANNRVEVAYSTFESERGKGIGTEMCRLLVELALAAKPDVIITARTLPEENHSTKILRKNSFTFVGIVNDPEDGEVWEWIYNG